MTAKPMGEKRARLLALLQAGELEGKSCRQIGQMIGASAAYVSLMVRQLREHGAAESALPKGVPPPDDTPLEKVRYLFPLRSWNALMSYGWMFKPDAPLKVLKDAPDDFLLAMPQLGAKALGVIRNRFGYGDGYPPGARKFCA